MIAERPANRTNKWRNYALIALALTGVGVLVLLYLRRRYWQAGEVTQLVTPSHPMTHLTATGLTEAEAAARLEPEQDNLI